MSIINEKHKVLIFSAYPLNSGGGSQMQIRLNHILEVCLPEADVHTIYLMESHSKFHLYMHSFKQAFHYYHKNLTADLFILQSYLDPGILVLGYLARRNKVPYILMPRGDLVPTVDLFFKVRRPCLKWVVWQLFGRQLVKCATAVVVTSEMEKIRLDNVGAHTKHFHIIPNYIQISFPDDIRKDLMEKKEVGHNPFALWLGRIAHEKGLELLLECWPTVLSDCSQAKLILVGPVDHQRTLHKLKRLITKLCLGDAVQFIEWADGDEKLRLLSQARCLVLPSHFESFGNTVVEALSMQTPVIASTGTPWSHIDGVAGRWLPLKPQLWAEAMITYLKTPEKKKVPQQSVLNLLAPYSESSVTEQWRTLLGKIRS